MPLSATDRHTSTHQQQPHKDKRLPAANSGRQAGHETILAGPGLAPRNLYRGRQPAPGPANSAESDTGNITVGVVPGQSLRLVVQVIGARDADACRQRLVTGERHGRVQVVMGNVPGPGPAQGIRHRGLTLAKRRPAKNQTIPERKKGGRPEQAPALFRYTESRAQSHHHANVRLPKPLGASTPTL